MRSLRAATGRGSGILYRGRRPHMVHEACRHESKWLCSQDDWPPPGSHKRCERGPRARRNPGADRCPSVFSPNSRLVVVPSRRRPLVATLMSCSPWEASAARGELTAPRGEARRPSSRSRVLQHASETDASTVHAERA